MSKSFFGRKFSLTAWKRFGPTLRKDLSQQSEITVLGSRSMVNVNFPIGFAQLAPVVKT